jgi:hypothetical protein
MHVQARVPLWSTPFPVAKLVITTFFYPALLPIMSNEEEEEDFVFEKVDAGSSATIPMEAGQVKKGG